jgi:hypothetical protein
MTAEAANAAVSPPAETVPATITPMVAKQNGHIAHLLGWPSLAVEICSLSRLYRGDE